MRYLKQTGVSQDIVFTFSVDSRPVRTLVSEAYFKFIGRELSSFYDREFFSDHRICGRVNAKLIFFEHSSKEVGDLKELIEEEGIERHATLREVLSLSMAFPDLQLRFPIVAFGSSVMNDKGLDLFPMIANSDFHRFQRSLQVIRSDDVPLRSTHYLVIEE